MYVSDSAPGRPESIPTLAHRLRARETVVGYWMMLDAPPAVERIAQTGYDFIGLDTQHGLYSYDGMLRGLVAIDAATATGDRHEVAGAVRVGDNSRIEIGRAMDAGAQVVIVPMVSSAEEASLAVAFTRYGHQRSYGPMRSSLRFGSRTEDHNAHTAVIVMIETREGLEDVEQIAAVPGVDGIHIGPADLAISLGARDPRSSEAEQLLAPARRRVVAAAQAAGVAAGYHCGSGAEAALRRAEGFTMLVISSDLSHLTAAASAELTASGLRSRAT